MADEGVKAGAKGRGKRPKLGGMPTAWGTRRVAVTMTWEGSELEARVFGRLMKHLIADLDGSADRPLVLKLRRAWLTGCEAAGVADA